MTAQKQSALDLVECEREPIHAPGTVQATCALLLFDTETRKLVAGSDNLCDYFDTGVRDLIGCGPERFFVPPDNTIVERAMQDQERLVSRHLRLAPKGEHWARMFFTEGLLAIELNTFEDSEVDLVSFGVGTGEAVHKMTELATQIQSIDGAHVRQLAAMVADNFRDLSGYDRTMIYRFDTDWNGEVIGESRADHIPESFLGLSYPSSDIPRQARNLFLRNRLRPIIDLTRDPVPIVPPRNTRTGRPFDLSDCSVRGVSPIHVEYLRNMGVKATLNIALVVQGRLWGLLSCHHYASPYRLTPGRSSACQIFTEAFAASLSQIAERSYTRTMGEVRAAMIDLRNSALRADYIGAMERLLGASEDKILRTLDADGIFLRLEEGTFRIGTVPNAAVLSKLRARIADQIQDGETTFSTHFAAGMWEDLADALLPNAAGLLAHFGGSGRYELIAFRKKRNLDLTWGGDPYNRFLPQSESGRLHPRKSFEKWCETVQNRSLPWRTSDQVAAQETAIGLNEIGWLLQWRKSEITLAKARAETEWNALHDTLTDLPNRRYLTQAVERSNQPYSALLHIDLDGFKQINDSLGHAAGDHVLTVVSQRLRSQVRDGDFYARIGGDEFVILTNPAFSADEAIALGHRIVETMARPIGFGTETCAIGASVGVVANERTGLPLDLLLHRADMALYESKRNGRGTVTAFTQELEDRIARNQTMAEEIQTGIQSNQFRPWYQPQFAAGTHALVGVEALLRWHHPELGILTPDKFLALAEEIDQIAAIDALVLQQAAADYHNWTTEGFDVPKISLNLSARRLSDPALLEDVKKANLPPSKFSFELLETIYLDETDTAMDWNIDALRELGLTLQVDDFGTGRTSIVSLVRLKPDRLKIDRQLVDPVVRSEQARSLIASIVEIGNSLGIGVTAEGVETMEHARILSDLGCTVLQGFAFARPMSAEDLTRLLRQPERKQA